MIEQCPFYNKEKKKIEFQYRTLRDIVFIWPYPAADKIGNIFIPEFAQSEYRYAKGIVLAAGPGCRSQKDGKLTRCKVNVGDSVLFDKNVPWRYQYKDDSVACELFYMGEKDVKARLNVAGEPIPLSDFLFVEQVAIKEKEGSIVLPSQALNATDYKVLQVGEDVKEIRPDDVVMLDKKYLCSIFDDTREVTQYSIRSEHVTVILGRE